MLTPMTDFPPKPRNTHYHTKITHDIIIVIAITILISLFTLFFDLSEKFYQWSRIWEAYQVDELLFPLLGFAICLIWFSSRRYLDAKIESKSNLILLSENRQLIRNLTETQERERLLLAQELHDVFAQHLTALRTHAEIIQATTPTENTPLLNNTQKIIENVDKLHRVTRSLLKTLRPPLLDFGIVMAVEDLVTDWRQTHQTIDCQLTFHNDEPTLNEAETLAIYRTLQEGLSNIAKHTQAQQVDIHLYFPINHASDPAILSLALTNDDSISFSPDKDTSGLGMIGIKERAILLNGSFELTPLVPVGTKLTFSFPISQQDTPQ